eukprot:scaffold1912_cov167-Amphora_coffeaeformis.AAC.10
MGQSASKAAGRAAQRAAGVSVKPPSSGAPPSSARPIPTSNTSASAAAVEASARVRNPEYETHASPQDLAQQQLMKESKGESYEEMPDDLINFLTNAGPLKKQERESTPRRKEPRLPRQPWQGEAGKSDRIQESMPLAEKIEGYNTTKNTNFSRTSLEIKKDVYQKGTIINMYELLSLKRSSNGKQQSSFQQEEQVAQTYREYASEFPLPDQNHQDQHKELLANTLKYLDLPILMKDYKDNADSYDGVHPDEVDVYELMKYDMLPKSKARLALEDLHELERKEKSSS